MSYTTDLFRLDDRVVVITGGAGFLGQKHAEAVLDLGGVPVLTDLPSEKLDEAAHRLTVAYGRDVMGVGADLTREQDVTTAVASVADRFGRIDGLINNAAFTGKGRNIPGLFDAFEDYSKELWQAALDVNLTGTLLITQAVGRVMRTARCGAVLNIASDIALISPDHRIYRDLPDGKSFNTPIAYPTTKGALLSFTRYLATYWAPFGIRVNALCPAGVYDNQDAEFVKRLTNLIPMGRMATPDDYKGSVVYMLSDASAFMTGAVVVVDGGRTAW